MYMCMYLVQCESVAWVAFLLDHLLSYLFQLLLIAWAPGIICCVSYFNFVTKCVTPEGIQFLIVYSTITILLNQHD